MKQWLRRLYEWVGSWAETPFGPAALFAIAVAEAVFFPVPPDVLLIALALARPRRALVLAANCSIGSVCGGVAGYVIGRVLMENLGMPILEFYGAVGQYEEARQAFTTYGLWLLAIAGFTPIPYKVFTIASGATELDFVPFVLVSAASRSARFFLVAGLIAAFGRSISTFIDRYFDLLSILFVVLLVGGFVFLAWMR